MEPIMKPNPMFMILVNMRQNPHGPRNFQGNLAGTEKVVFSKEEAVAWLEINLRAGDKATLIQITELETYEWKDGIHLVSDEADEVSMTKEEAYQ